MKEYIYNPLNNKTPKGACTVGSTVSYSLRVSKFIKNIHSVNFVMHVDGNENGYYPMDRTYTDERYIHFCLNYKYETRGLYWYHFEVVLDNGEVVKLIQSDNLDVIESKADYDYLQLIYDNESNVDGSYHNGVIYHIFIDRFNRSGEVKCREGLTLEEDWNKLPIREHVIENGKNLVVNKICYGGNFRGITTKLDYLKSLNVNTIYLSPIWEANSSHRYDVANYEKIEEMYGGEEDFKELISKADSVGIKIIIDAVFNHTGSDSVYFNKYKRYDNLGAYQSEESPYFSWYIFDNFPDDYKSWWDIKNVPTTNKNSSFIDYIVGKNGIVEKYLKMGILGLRLDVVDELPNEFLSKICKTTRGIKNDAVIIGEVWEDASCKLCYDTRREYFLGGGLDSVTNYPMKDAILEYVKTGNLDRFVSTICYIKDRYPKKIQDNLMNILGTHDTVRVLTYLGESDEYDANKSHKLSKEERKKGIKLLKIASAIQYTIMGVPTIYYGDEAGIEGTKDPYNRATYPWGNEEKDLIEWYQYLGKLRNNPVFIDGELRLLYASNSVLIYERVKDDNKVLVAINLSDNDFKFVLNSSMVDYVTREEKSGIIIIPKNEVMILVSTGRAG